MKSRLLCTASLAPALEVSDQFLLCQTQASKLGLHAAARFNQRLPLRLAWTPWTGM